MADLKTKSFFDRPEGKTGLIFGILALAAGAYGLYFLLPFIVILLTNTLHAMLLAATIAFIVFLVADPRVRTLGSYFYKSIMRFITGLFIEIDPIGILNGYVADLHKRIVDMQKSMANLEGQKRKLKSIIDGNEERRKHSLQMAAQANKDPNMKPAFILQSRQAGRLGKSNLTLQALYAKMEGMSKVLKKMYETSQFLVQDIEGEVEVKTAERAAIKASYNAFTAARKIVQGDTDQKALFDQTMEHLADDYAMKVGEIETFMEMSNGFIQSVDLENGVYEQDALDQFEQWEKKADNLLLDGPARIAVQDTPKKRVDSGTYPAAEEQEAEESSFDDLFNTKK